MAQRKRLIGIAADPEPGGTPFDDRVDGEILEPTLYLPIEGGNASSGADHRTREKEVRAGGGQASPEPWRANPNVNGIEVKPYPILLKILTLAGLAIYDDVRSGSPPAAVTHGPHRPTTDSLGPAFDFTVIGDELAEQVGGCQITKFSVDLDLSGESKITFDAPGLFWREVDPDDFADSEFSDIEPHDFVLRDMSVFLDGSEDPALRVRGFTFDFDSNAGEPEPEAGLNVQESEDDPDDRVWWPNRIRRGFRHTPTVKLMFSEPQPEMQVRNLFAQGLPIVVEVTGDYLGTTPNVRERVRWTFDNAVPTESSPAGIGNDPDRIHDITFLAALDDENGTDDVAVEFLDASNVDIAVPVGS